MKQFDDLGQFASFLSTLAWEIEVAEQEALKKAAELIEREAKAEIGHYQTAAGPFPEWDPLSGATLRGKEAHEYAPPDNPLLQEGDLRDSIKSAVSDHEAVVGSDSEIAVYQEMGTPDAVYPIPARSFLGRAAFRKELEVVEGIGGAIAAAIAGQAEE